MMRPLVLRPPPHLLEGEGRFRQDRPMISWLKKQSLRSLLLVSVIVGLIVLPAVAWLVDLDNRERLGQAFHWQNAQAQDDPTPPAGTADKKAGSSEAERIARLHRALDVDEKQLKDAKKRLADPN